MKWNGIKFKMTKELEEYHKLTRHDLRYNPFATDADYFIPGEDRKMNCKQCSKVIDNRNETHYSITRHCMGGPASFENFCEECFGAMAGEEFMQLSHNADLPESDCKFRERIQQAIGPAIFAEGVDLDNIGRLAGLERIKAK